MIQFHVFDATLNLILSSQHIGLTTETDRNTHFHEHINANTEIMKRRPYLEWKIYPRSMEVYRLSLYKSCDKELYLTAMSLKLVAD